MAMTTAVQSAARVKGDSLPAFGPGVSPELRALAESWRRTLVAENASANTIRQYWGVLRGFAAFLSERGMPQQVEAISREHIESYIAELLATRAPNTALDRFKVLRTFFHWLVEEADELARSPMEKMRAPRVQETPPPVLDEEALVRLLQSCAGKAFEDRRDLAILSLLLDGGLRRMEIVGLRLEHVDWNLNVVTVVGKGNRVRSVPFGRRTAKALDAYLRARSRHELADEPWLWLGRQGRLSYGTLYWVVRQRAEAAGISDRAVWPHLFRHTFAHRWMAEGGSEKGLMELAGWRSRTMVDRYGASAAHQRAIDEHRTHSPLDNLTADGGSGKRRKD